MRLKIRSRNSTANKIRGKIFSKTKALFRLGSTTPTNVVFPGVNPAQVKEINTVEACKVSGNKISMKKAFETANVKTAEWSTVNNTGDWQLFPAIIKHKNSSKGNGIFFIADQNALDDFKNTHNELKNYIIEKYYTYSREYRLHVTSEGCFYTCRKMLREDAEERWHRHDNNCVWILEENELFDKPTNWEDIVSECVKALQAVGLDIAALDIKVQSARDSRGRTRNNPDFIILETNSAPSLGDTTAVKYIEQLTKMCN